MSETETKETKEIKEKIIIAEDSPPNRKILMHLLGKMGFEVVGCENGEIAFNALNLPENSNTVALLSDIMMPVMDGIELLQAVRKSEKFKNLPVLLISAVSDKEYIVQAKNSEVNGYILKPVTYQRVQNKMQELFPNKVFPKQAA